MTLRLKHGDSLVVASHNKGKLREFEDLFGPLGITLIIRGPWRPRTRGDWRHLRRERPVESGYHCVRDESVRCRRFGPRGRRSGWCARRVFGALGGESRDFQHAMQKVEDALQAKGATSPSERRRGIHLCTLPCKSDGRGPILRRESRRTFGVAASGRRGLATIRCLFPMATT